MRLILSLGAASLALAGCVAPVTTAPTAPVVNPPVIIQPPASTNTLDAAARVVSRQIVNNEMAKRLPGRNVAPYTDCVINSASMAELADIAARGAGDSSAVAGSVAVIVKRPATTQCIAKVAATA